MNEQLNERRRASDAKPITFEHIEIVPYSEKVELAYGYLFHITDPDEKTRAAREALDGVLCENSKIRGIAAARILGAKTISWDMASAGC